MNKIKQLEGEIHFLYLYPQAPKWRIEEKEKELKKLEAREWGILWNLDGGESQGKE